MNKWTLKKRPTSDKDRLAKYVKSCSDDVVQIAISKATGKPLPRGVDVGKIDNMMLKEILKRVYLNE